MKKAGVIILIVGLIVTVFTGLKFVTKEKVVDLGKLEISADKSHSLSWSPVMGLLIMVIGAGAYMVGIKK